MKFVQLSAFVLTFAWLGLAQAAQVIELRIEGTIDPAIADYVHDGIQRAVEEQAQAILIHLDTPGGLLQSTRDIVKQFLDAPVPILVWVTPGGAHAASAGMFITTAAHVAAMTPGTNIGAATPISGQGKDVAEEGGQALEAKVLEDTKAFARSIANVRKRPAAWMERAVTEAVSATAQEAFELGVVDVLASTAEDLFQAIDQNALLASAPITGPLTNATITPHALTLGQQFMHWLAHPNIAYILMSIGSLGLFFELSAPGGFVGGVVGVIALLLAFISMQILPFQAGGLALIALAIALFVIEVFVPSFGIFSIGGLVSFVVGSLILFKSPEMDMTLDVELVATATVVIALCLAGIGYLVARAQARKKTTGSEGMIGMQGEVTTTLSPRGMVFIHGEHWQARTEGEHIDVGQTVEVTSLEGLRLVVRPQESLASTSEER